MKFDSLADKIKHVRTQKGQSLIDAGNAVGVSDVAFGYWETGRNKVSDARKLAVIEWSGNFITLNDFYDLPAGGDIPAVSQDNAAATVVSMPSLGQQTGGVPNTPAGRPGVHDGFDPSCQQELFHAGASS